MIRRMSAEIALGCAAHPWRAAQARLCGGSVDRRQLLTARKLVQSKLFDAEICLRGILRGFGLKVGPTTPPRFGERIRDLVAGHATLEVVAAALLAVHETLRREFDGFEKRVRSMARDEDRALKTERQ